MLSASASMAGYPKVFNIEMDPHEDLVVAGLFTWAGEPALEVVKKYLDSLKKHVKRLSRFPASLLPNSTSVWSMPSMGRSVGIFAPTTWAKVGMKSIMENIAYELVSGLTLPGQRTKQKVRIEPSVASPSSPRKGPELPMSGVP